MKNEKYFNFFFHIQAYFLVERNLFTFLIGVLPPDAIKTSKAFLTLNTSVDLASLLLNLFSEAFIILKIDSV